MAEQINTDKGIGFMINNARDFLRIDIIIFGLIVYALLGIGTDAIVRELNARDFLRIDIIIFGLIVYALLGIGTDAIVRELERRALRYRT